MRWWIVLCAAVLWDTASLQPTKEVDNAPDRECCPCPKDSAVDSTNTLETVNPIEDQSAAGSSVPRDAGVGGCPCQLRSADSEGASSVFFPTAVRAVRPFVGLEDEKEDPKPLLHPEVDLASSVLDTLREATNEEYNDALARDAARAAQESDEIAAESVQNLVTVVINPKDTPHDDVMPEATHVHEARCIHPLGRSSLSLKAPAYNSPDLLAEILRLPKRKPPTFRAWNLFDMDSGVGASNVNEQVVEPTFKESDVEIPKTPALLKFSTESNEPQSTLNLRIPTLFKTNNGRESLDSDLASILNKLKSTKVPSKLEISDISKLIPRMDTSHLLRKSGDDDLSINTKDTDTRYSPNTFKLQIPHITTLIPKIDSSSQIRKTEENKISTANDVRDENSDAPDTIRFNIPVISNLIPNSDSSSLHQNSNDDVLNLGMGGSENDLKLKIPKLKTTIQNNQIVSDDTFDSDSLNSASNLQERYSSFAKVNTDDNNALDSNTIEINNDFKSPAVKSVNLKNIENFDIEDNTLKKIGLNLKVPDFKLAPSKSRDATTHLLNNLFKGLHVPHLSNLISHDIFHLRKNALATKSTEQKEVAEETTDSPFVTEILDTVPSPSEPQSNHVLKHDNIAKKDREDDISNMINEEMENMIEELPVKTEILDSLPKSTEVNDTDDTEDPIINEVGIDNEEFINAANEQTQKSLGKDEEISELVNEIEIMNEDSIDDVIEDNNNGVMERENHADNNLGDFGSVRTLDEIGNDDFAAENHIDGLAINSDIQSLSEKNVPEMSSISNHDALIPLRERFRQRLESLKLAPKTTIDFYRLNGVEKLQKYQDRLESQNKDATTKNLVLDSEGLTENIDQVNIEDLQNMSDSLLNQEKKQKDASLDENIKSEIINIEPSNLNNDVQSTDNTVLETNDIINVNNVDNACIVNDNSNKMTTSENNEMAAGASERVESIAGPNFNLGSQLRQSIILEPTSFGSDLNLFNRPDLDLSNILNNPLPAFKIPNVLEVREGSSLKLLPTNDNSLDILKPKSLLAQSSASKFRSSLPTLQPLEDINLDVLKPLSIELPTLPTLNMNSFSTKLALPKSLDLKPVLLESSVGNKNEMVGATLTLGSPKKLDNSNMLQQASPSLKSSNILRQSIRTLPSLDDLHETLWENTQNLLSTPLETTGRNVVEDTLRSSQVLTDNLRVEAENAVKDIQQNLGLNFRGAGLHSGLGSFRSSGDLLEEITRHHEDVNDKLKGISVDLSDRLESLRDNILDQYRIPSLGSSLLSQSLSSLSTSFPKQSSTFRTKPPQNTLKFSNKGKFVTPATKRKSSSRSSTNKNKLKTASSVTAPKAVQIPILKTAPKESKVFKALGKESTLKTPQFLSRDRPTLSLLQPQKNLINFDRPLLKNPRLGQSKVQISFSTTPLPPTFRSKSSPDLKLKAKPLSLKNTLPTSSRSALKNKKRLGSKLSSFRDSSGFASEAIPSKVKAPFQKSSRFRTATVDLNSNIFNVISTTTVKPIISLTKSKSSLGKMADPGVERPATLLKSKLSVPDGTAKSESLLRKSNASPIAALSWPKKIDDDFLTKVREALRARLAGVGKLSAKPITESKLRRVEPSSDVDMARSASNNIEVQDPKIMQENTPYTCKMMCTKNT